MDKQDIHLHEMAYLTQIKKYLFDAYGKTISDLALDDNNLLKGFNDHVFPVDFVDHHAKEWGIKRKESSIPGTAARIVHV